MKKDRRRYMKYAGICLVVLVVLCAVFATQKKSFYHKEIVKLSEQPEEEFRAMKLNEEQIVWFRNHNTSESKKWLKEYEAVIKDMKVFPVEKDLLNGVGWGYENSWNEERTYGGKRFHEGTDIIAGNDERGYFTVVSVSDGVVEKKGWLEKGGWRIGVRSPGGVYYYYAHLCDYAEGIEEGSEVHAGDVIGTMGDTGYSQVEGTVGNFCVHLHFGIYLDINGEEKSVNPYWILKNIEHMS